MKRFHTRDGHGLGRLRERDIAVAFVTAEDSPIASARAAKLGVLHVVLGCQDKAAAVRELAELLGLARHEIAAIGDDLGDLAAFEEAGVAVAVGDAVSQVVAAADLVCSMSGGHGAVRELADLIVDAHDARVASASQ
jgi:3-deoxy-D-manno-octulosonate 8-phosphate phosphatase (KDO 8-P phosphatase)